MIHVKIYLKHLLLLEQIRWHIVRDTSDLSIILLPDQASHRMLASTPIISNAGHNDSLSPPKVYISDLPRRRGGVCISRYM